MLESELVVKYLLFESVSFSSCVISLKELSKITPWWLIISNCFKLGAVFNAEKSVVEHSVKIKCSKSGKVASKEISLISLLDSMFPWILIIFFSL